ncbi:MAG: hypothetical protein HY094_01310 [Candidatus Melainabacteria bacterium]|nr:hypothetical protein [Candidatus Melainabacteria bacterium]
MKAYTKKSIFILTGLVLLFVFTEGIFSTLLSLKYLLSTYEVDTKEAYTKHDSLLGWTSISNFSDNNFFGPGINLRTNSQSFRNDHDFNVEIPKNMIRVICCGDSFTFGYGVDNAHTWCEKLALSDKRLETINMGQVGFGIDQFYLWYMRDGKRFNHNIHLLAFITEDIYRINDDRFSLYNKPKLKLINEKLSTTNTPVPKHSDFYYKLQDYSNKLCEFRTYQFISRLITSTRFTGKKNQNGANEPELQKILSLIFKALYKENKAKNSNLVLIYLPQYSDCFEVNGRTAYWRNWIKDEAKNKDIFFIDLVSEFQKLPSEDIYSLFTETDRHFSNKGNKLIATILYKKLISLGLINAK